MQRVLSISILSVGLCVGSSRIFSAELAYDEQMALTAKDFAEQLTKAGKKKVAAIDLVSLQGDVTELGRMLTDQLISDLFRTKSGFILLDRANLKAILDEHELTEKGLAKDENQKKLADFAGVDCLIIGTIANDGKFIVQLKGIDTKTREIVAASTGKFPATEGLYKLWNGSVSLGIESNNNSQTAIAGTGTSGVIKGNRVKAAISGPFTASVSSLNIVGDELALNVVLSYKLNEVGDGGRIGGRAPEKSAWISLAVDPTNTSQEQDLGYLKTRAPRNDGFGNFNTATAEKFGFFKALSVGFDSQSTALSCSAVSGIPIGVKGERMFDSNCQRIGDGGRSMFAIRFKPSKGAGKRVTGPFRFQLTLNTQEDYRYPTNSTLLFEDVEIEK